MGGRSFVALGSAPSVNRHLLTQGIDWWPSEVILEEHVEATIAGGHAEVMLTHDSPGPPYCTEPVADTIRNSGNVRLLDLDTLTDATEMDGCSHGVPQRSNDGGDRGGRLWGAPRRV